MATRLEPTRNSTHFGARKDDGVVEVANGQLRVHAIKSEGVSVNAEVNLTHFPASSGVNP